MNQLPENSLRIYDVTLVTSYLIGLTRHSNHLFCLEMQVSPYCIVITLFLYKHFGYHNQ